MAIPSPNTMLFTPRQMEFILHANAAFNIAEGSVRAGKTVGCLFSFMQRVYECPGEQIWMIGHTHETIYHNCVRLLLDDSPLNPLSVFTPFVSWQKSGVLHFMGKKVHCLGARDERSIGAIQGKTFDLVYCNEMTLYPENVIAMIATRLSMPHSKLIADMNPVNPSHVCKRWVDYAKNGDPKYYALHFTMDDNPFLSDSYKQLQKQTLSGLFYRRNYLGEWCLAEGAIFDFFDKNIHVTNQKKACDFWIAGIDYGASNATACVILGVKTKKYANDYGHLQVQAEYYYDPKGKRTKTNGELARDILELFERYPIRSVYLDPSAASFRAELRANGVHTCETDNDVSEGITRMTSMVAEGQVGIHMSCTNLIREIEGYCWDSKASAKGEDAPMKVNDHAVDALRYAIMGYMGGGGGSIDFPITGNPNDVNLGRGLGQQRVQTRPNFTEVNRGQWMMR
jgi:PBSX family phage terminase large subunit